HAIGRNNHVPAAAGGRNEDHSQKPADQQRDSKTGNTHHRDSSSARSLGGVIGGRPPPGAGAVAALEGAFAIDAREDIPRAGEERAWGAHLGAQGQFPFGDAIAPVLAIFLLGMIGLGPASAERALVHFPARAKIAGLRILGSSERACIEAVAATYAQ